MMSSLPEIFNAGVAMTTGCDLARPPGALLWSMLGKDAGSTQ
jgi:hypothetical protein